MFKTVIRPVSDLSKKISDIEDFVIEQDIPVHLTKNGSNHMVLMSSSHYEMLLAKINMYENLLRSEAEIRQARAIPLDTAMAEIDKHLKERLNDKAGRVSY